MILAQHSALDCDDKLEVRRDRRDRVSARIALMDSRGVIVAVNKDWATFAEETGAISDRIGAGSNYLEACRRAGTAVSRKALSGIQQVLAGKTASFTMDYKCSTEQGIRCMRMGVTPIVGGIARLAIAHTDVTDLKLSKQKNPKRLQEFARQLIRAQEEERQKIAREIHDAVGNRIAMLSLTVHQTEKKLSDAGGSSRELDKVLEGISNLSNVLRNLSHWLHPPALRYLGIGPALKALQDDFEKAYSIRIDLDVPQDLPRFPSEVELCVYRISQECLQNVAKHSGVDCAKVVFEDTGEEIRLTVSDSGYGFDLFRAVRTGGLGLISMEERAAGARGSLAINTAPGKGTEVRLTISAPYLS
jgi:signal transduction histidine kinase